jgi:hypothetical protein
VSVTHLELLLETLPGADRNQLSDRLRAKGFDPLPMKAGLLLSAELGTLRKLLPMLTAAETGELAVPEDLKHAVASIRIFKPRSLHSS